MANDPECQEKYQASLDNALVLSSLLNEYDNKLFASTKREKIFKDEAKKYKCLYEDLLKHQQLNLFNIYNVPY